MKFSVPIRGLVTEEVEKYVYAALGKRTEKERK